MSADNIIALVVSVALVGFLVVALLAPERL